jgi:hypothetical protein
MGARYAARLVSELLAQMAVDMSYQNCQSKLVLLCEVAVFVNSLSGPAPGSFWLESGPLGKQGKY